MLYEARKAALQVREMERQAQAMRDRLAAQNPRHRASESGSFHGAERNPNYRRGARGQHHLLKSTTYQQTHHCLVLHVVVVYIPDHQYSVYRMPPLVWCC